MATVKTPEGHAKANARTAATKGVAGGQDKLAAKNTKRRKKRLRALEFSRGTKLAVRGGNGKRRKKEKQIGTKQRSRLIGVRPQWSPFAPRKQRFFRGAKDDFGRL
jgi:hypothetical protein